MSFSGSIKEELVKLEGSSRHCRIAELAALMIYSDPSKASPAIIKKRNDLIFDIFNTDEVSDEKIMQTVKHSEGEDTVDPVVIKNLCCKRCFLRGVFLSIGSMSNPEKGYHLEFVCDNMRQAQ